MGGNNWAAIAALVYRSFTTPGAFVVGEQFCRKGEAMNSVAAPHDEDSLGRTYGYWKFPTVAGLFRIVPHFGRYRAMWEDETIGSYTSPRRAATGIASAPSVKLGRSADDTRCTLPTDLRQWIFVQLRRAEN